VAAAGVVEPPQADKETVQAAAAATTANFMVRMEKPFGRRRASISSMP
jgi:hypothetical protein